MQSPRRHHPASSGGYQAGMGGPEGGGSCSWESRARNWVMPAENDKRPAGWQVLEFPPGGQTRVIW